MRCAKWQQRRHDDSVSVKESAKTCDVLVFGGRINSVLTYANPGSLPRGAMVTVPYGKQKRTGVIIGDGTYEGGDLREIETFHNFVLSESEFSSLEEIGRDSLLSLNKMLERIAPRLIDKAPAVEIAVKSEESAEEPESDFRRDTLLYLTAGSDKHEAAAWVARDLKARGQVLLMCPTKRDAAKLCAMIDGAVLLQSPDTDGSYERFLSGVAPVGVGTRGSVFYRGQNIKSIVVLDPHAKSYIEQHRPHLNVAELARSRSLSEDLLFVGVGRSAPSRVLRGLVLKTMNGERPPSLEFVARTRGVVPPALQSSMASVVKRGGHVCVLSDENSNEICSRCNRVASGEECHLCGGRERKRVGVLRDDLRRAVSPGVDVMTRRELLESGESYDVLVMRDAHLSFSRASFNPYQDMLDGLGEIASKVRSGGKIVLLSPERYSGHIGGLKTWGGACRAVVREAGRDGLRVTLEITSESRPKIPSGTVRWRGPIESTNKKGKCWRWITVSDRDGLERVQVSLQEVSKRNNATWSVN